MKGLVTRCCMMIGCIILGGCINMKLAIIANENPPFHFEQYFLGHTKASGWFTDRFGNVKRHFCGDFYGFFDNNEFVLDESLYYVDGIIEKRTWRVTNDNNGSMIARSSALVGDAVGKINGNTLYLEYVMKVEVEPGKKWALSMKDWMFFQPDGSLHNATYVHKWGVRLGTVSTQYIKHDGLLSCAKA